MKKENEGFSVRDTPAQKIRVCTGCKYLDKQAMMRGHKSVTDNYTCQHPDFADEHPLFSKQNGRTIYFNHEGECTTPNWCPFLK